jgi:hypothetical protein
VSKAVNGARLPSHHGFILYLKLCDIFSEHAEDLLSISTLNLHKGLGVLSLIAENMGFLTFPC